MYNHHKSNDQLHPVDYHQHQRRRTEGGPHDTFSKGGFHLPPLSSVFSSYPPLIPQPAVTETPYPSYSIATPIPAYPRSDSAPLLPSSVASASTQRDVPVFHFQGRPSSMAWLSLAGPSGREVQVPSSGGMSFRHSHGSSTASTSPAPEYPTYNPSEADTLRSWSSATVHAGSHPYARSSGPDKSPPIASTSTLPSFIPVKSLLESASSHAPNLDESESSSEGALGVGMSKTRKRRRKQSEAPRDAALRKYGCVTCGKKFARPSALTLHSRSHTKDKPHSCHFPACQRAFAVISNLRRHQKLYNHETPDGDAPSDGSGEKPKALGAQGRRGYKDLAS